MNTPRLFPSLWNLAGNPVFRRYAAARLRPLRLAVWVLFTQLLVGFMWLIGAMICLLGESEQFIFSVSSSEFRELLAAHGREAALAAWLPVLVVQVLLMIIMGTFSVATGVAREGNEGMMDAMLLTPMPTGHRVVGQLLGLPVLENLLALLLMPWVGLSMWLGHLPPAMVGKIYLLLATSVLFHHAVGLLAGTIIRQKILAGTLSQVCVLLLHFVLPYFGKFGIGMIAYLAVEPAIQQVAVASLPEVFVTLGMAAPDSMLTTVRFFRWELGLPGYHWLITVSALAALLWVLARRWKNPESQLLGKIGTIVLSAWLLLLTCGEFIPLLESGGIPTRSLQRYVENGLDENGSGISSGLGLLRLVAIGVAMGCVNLLLTSALVPSPQARRRAVGHRWWSDGRDAMPWVAAISVLSAVAWCGLFEAFFKGTSSSISFTHAVAAGDAWVLFASLVVPSAAWYALVLWRGWQQALVIGFLVAVLPLMLSSVSLLGFGKTFSGLDASALLLPWHGAMLRFSPEGASMPQAVFFTSLGLHTVAAAVMWWLARGAGRAPDVE